MTKEQFIKNLNQCTKHELIEMMVIQWMGLGQIQDQIEEGERAIAKIDEGVR